MRYRKLGARGVKVSEISLGSWLTYGGSVEDDRAIACRICASRPLRRLPGLAPWDASTLEGAFRQLASELGVKLVDLAQPVRLGLTGRTASPPIFGVMADLGREETLRR